MYESERDTAVAIVAEVCELTHRVQDTIVAAGDAVTKDDRSPVTLADLAAQIVVSHRLAKAFPDSPLLAEEDSDALDPATGITEQVLDQVVQHIPDMTTDMMVEALDRGDHAGDGDRYWVLDPIDGTKGFLRGDQYAVALALVVGGTVEIGVLGCPNLPAGEPGQVAGSLFSAIRDAGARNHTLDGNVQGEIQVDGISDAGNAVMCESVVAAHAAHSVQGRIASNLGITAPSYRIDSQCKYAVVARGDASIYLRLPRDSSYREKVWDHAAGALIVEEAGGRVSDLDGNPLDFSKGRFLGHGNGIICTNGAIHEQVLTATRTELENRDRKRQLTGDDAG
jgi:3'(2'), 5'-bisphosphate nucleotidase